MSPIKTAAERVGKSAYGASFVRYSKLFSRRDLEKNLPRLVKKYHLCGKKRILNIGAGGSIENRLAKEGVKFTTVDIDPARRPDLVMNIEDMRSIKSGTVDVFLCFEILEHVKDPFRGVSEMRRCLKHDGLIVGSTPFLQPIHDAPHDYYRYTRYGLEQLFKGFEILEMKERNGYMDAAYVVLVRAYNTGPVSSRLRATLVFPIILCLWPVHKVLGLVIGNNPAGTTGYRFVLKKRRSSRRSSRN